MDVIGVNKDEYQLSKIVEKLRGATDWLNVIKYSKNKKSKSKNRKKPPLPTI
jgi:hypothetical protein